MQEDEPTHKKLIKLALACLTCIGLISLMVFLIESISK